MAERPADREFLLAGLIDSFGLSLGWTTFTLLAVERHGLSTAALYNAAMLIGIVLSAPATMWLSRVLSGGALLTLVGAVELPLRVLTLAGLLLGTPAPVISAAVVAMNVAAWTGYAGMRAEVADRAPGPRAMVRYAVAIAAIEAAAASVAALLPVTSSGAAGRLALTAVLMLYPASLAPQFWCARHARVPSGRQLAAVPDPLAELAQLTEVGQPVRPADRSPVTALLLAGTAVMLIGSGPATLNTALAVDLYGQLSVIAASIAFTAGCLLATRASAAVSRLRASTGLLWTGWGIGMLVGWLVAPWQLTGLLLAQLLSGLCLTAFHGEMDSAISATARPERLTTLLAVAGALRAIGSAVAVRLLPLLVGLAGLVGYATGLIALLAVGSSLLALLGRTSSMGPALSGARPAPGRHRASSNRVPDAEPADLAASVLTTA
ncbi:hypothetical protein [Jatrophihabitans sp.]|uniref:hypothetical protein n=1 Tax=Jatrophihabitans sp. TaxID=1932789 RepID=UPI002CAACBA0|nr:hypothetical protein [Jatrophihabitans sp.]